MSVTTTGCAGRVSAVNRTSETIAVRMCVSMESPLLHQTKGHENHVDQLYARERENDAPDTVDPDVTAQDGGGADGPVADALQGQRDQRDDDQRVEDDRRQDRALGRRQPHDVERVEYRICRGERRRGDREVLCNVA